LNTHDDDSHSGDTATAAHSLTALQEEFPQFRIWREITLGRARCNARSLHPGTHPHTVITPDPGELRAALTAGATEPPADPAPRHRDTVRPR
jgi:hypothetical protein